LWRIGAFSPRGLQNACAARAPRPFHSQRGETMTVNAMTSALQQMQTLAAQAADNGDVQSSGAATAGSFSAALKASLDKISADQKTANNEAQAFELGAPNVSLNDVMIDGQKANIGFQFGLQVRNKLVTAYNDIMQMSV
jgi:flagellar hook-basal body complex protein FliE